MKRLILLPGMVLAFALAMLPSGAYAQLSVPEPGRTGSISIHKYAAEEGEEGTPATGEELEITGLEPLSGISFTVTRVGDEDTDPLSASPMAGEGAYMETLATDENGLAVFPGLAQGVYLVREQAYPGVQAPVEDFLVSVPATNPAGTGWLYEVNVYPKNRLAEAPALHLYVTREGNRSQPLAQGGTADWIATADIPLDIGTAQRWEIAFAPDSSLTYVEDSLAVSARGEGGEPVDLTADVHYTFSAQGPAWVLELLPDGREKLAGDAAGGALTARYAARLDIPAEELPQSLAQPVQTTARLHYTNGAGVTRPSAEPDSPPYVYTGGLKLHKVDARTGGNLEGAAFKLYPTEEDARAGQNALPAPGAPGTDWEAVTGEDGLASFYGLAYGAAGDSSGEGRSVYYLVETRAPAGYNLLRAPVEVKVDAVSHMQGNEVAVRGSTGFTLPATGGAGTVLFTVAGLFLIGLAVLLYLRSKTGRK